MPYIITFYSDNHTMKRNTITFLTTIILSIAILSSCKSTPTTFVNTGADTNGEVYTVYVFSKLTKVNAVNKETGETFVIPTKKCKYESVTTKVQIPLDKSIPYKAEELTFHVEGKMATPYKFILYNLDKKRENFIVFVEGKPVSLGTDYTYDSKTSCITFITEDFMPNMSYEILWITDTDGMSSISNDFEKFKDKYESLALSWIETL